LRSKSGRVLSDDVVKDLADRMERGYEPDHLQPRKGGRPPWGEDHPSPRIQVGRRPFRMEGLLQSARWKGVRRMAETRVVPLPYRREGTWSFDPAAELARLRAEEPVVRYPLPNGGHAWLVTRYADAREVLGDSRFSNALAPSTLLRPREGDEVVQDDEPQPGAFIVFDPPEHTRFRRLLTPEFTIRRMNALRPRIEEIVAQHLDAMAAAGPPADLVQAFALPVPSLVICELLGVPYADRAEFQSLTGAALDLTLPQRRSLEVFGELASFMLAFVARERRDPGPGLLGDLVREHGDQFTDPELGGIGGLLLLAGHETTANMLGLGTLLLLQHPEQLAAMREDPEAVDPAVEELMRYLTIVPHGVVRTATEDVMVGGQLIGAGEYVIVHLPSADRDRSLCAEPDRFDITRAPGAHVGFGHGIHYCLGAPLARLEMQIAFPALLRRFPGLRLAGTDTEVAFRTMSAVYGLDALPVAW
jgi:cytochrome P450